MISGDTVLLSPPNPSVSSGEALFHLAEVRAPRLGSARASTVDEPGAWASRDWLRNLLIGKLVRFSIVRQSPERYYGLLELQQDDSASVNVQSVRLGHCTVKNPSSIASISSAAASEDTAVVNSEFAQALLAAEQAAKAECLNVHSQAPVVRRLLTANEEFTVGELVREGQGRDNGRVNLVIEHCFDGGRFRCEEVGSWKSFVLQLAGIASPRVNDHPLGPAAKFFVDLRVQHRSLEVTLLGQDKNGSVAVGNIHHPKGNIALELLKSGLAMISEWSARFLEPLHLAEYRRAEAKAKDARLGIWKDYQKPKISGIAQASGTVIEVVTGDTFTVLPSGTAYASESSLLKLSLASIRSPRLGNRQKPDDPYSHECKERLRQLLVGKQVTVVVDYERDIPAGENTIKRKFATVSVGKKADVGEVLLSEGLATLQFHRDGEVRSSRYDELSAAEAAARAAKKNIHSSKDAPLRKVNDCCDPKKAKGYVGFLQRSGALKATVEYVFSGSRYKLWIPKENCSIMFALSEVRCPQVSRAEGAIH